MKYIPTHVGTWLICLKRTGRHKKKFFLNNVISNVKTAPGSLHLQQNNWQITGGLFGRALVIQNN